MITSSKMQETFKEIQTKLFQMIPEKWSKIYLYASIVEGINNLETGELYFYYEPKSILKKDFVNVYEVPSKFNINEDAYFKKADELYKIIKKLRIETMEANETDDVWSNVTISIENFKFKVEFKYDDLNNSEYSSYDRHIIWRYNYLNTSINTYNKKERNIILDYLKENENIEEMVDTYIEGMYKTDAHNIIEYDREEKFEEVPEKVKKEKKKESKATNNQILNFKKKD